MSVTSVLVQAIAAKVDGYDAADLRVLLDRAALAAARRGLADVSLDLHRAHRSTQHSALSGGAGQGEYRDHAPRALYAPLKNVNTGEAASAEEKRAEGGTGVPVARDGEQLQQVWVTGDDLTRALQGFTPAAYWGVRKLSGGGSGVQASHFSLICGLGAPTCVTAQDTS